MYRVKMHKLYAIYSDSFIEAEYASHSVEEVDIEESLMDLDQQPR